LSRQLDALDTIGMTTQERHLLLNRSGAKVGLGQEEVEQTLGLPVQFNIPSNRAVPVSTNQGAPIIISNPRENAARALDELVKAFSPRPTDDARGRRFWRKDES
jgi:pilus assembly protein CpaE